jgi:hypothetical protein
MLGCCSWLTAIGLDSLAALLKRFGAILRKWEFTPIDLRSPIAKETAGQVETSLIVLVVVLFLEYAQNSRPLAFSIHALPSCGHWTPTSTLLVRTFDLAPLQRLQPGGPGGFSQRRKGGAPSGHAVCTFTEVNEVFW